MPVTERYQVNIFAIVVLIVAVITIIFLVIAAIYFFDLTKYKPPTSGESLFLFWTSILMAVVLFIIVIYSLIEIFTHKSIIYENVPQKSQSVVESPKSETKVITQSKVTKPEPIVVSPSPINVSNVVKTTRPTDLSINLSDVPVTKQQRSSLNEELISLGEIVSE